MKKFNYLFVTFAFALMGYSSALRADDTDIYVSNSTNAAVPNVLFVIDTSASFDAAATTCSYASGGSPTPNGKAAGIEICALVDSISSLPDGVMNIGIMTTNSNNYANDVRSTSDVAYHEVCPSGAGGCLVRKLLLMNSTNKTSLINFLKTWDTSGQSSATVFNAKSSTTHTGGMMQEAWAYYNGKIGQSGKDYGTSILASGCQKNFVIFIGNAFGNSGTPGDGNTSPYSDTYGLGTSYVGASAAQKLKISESVVFSGPTCDAGASPLYPSPQVVKDPSTSASDWSENWADEWARFMYQADGGTGAMEGSQNITTYTIGVLSTTNACKADYPALLTTMAKYGGGSYFRTGTATEIKNALTTILNEVQAVNSVFSSASLPVSVNADGSYLNQIYLGMFRPDATGSPRWLGNLKQYHLIKSGTGALVQGDANDNAAINANTGFIKPDAVSFWTRAKDVTTLPDSAGGYWKNAAASQGTILSPYDNPDGEVVEKGGVGQQLRLEAITANYTTTAQSSTNPRRMYTYCPAGTTCTADLTNSANIFATTNGDIASAAFGISSTLNVTSIVRTGTSALVTTSGNHGFTAGTTQATISGATQSEYNVTQTISSPSSNTTFTITGLPDYPSSPATLAYTVSSSASGAVAVQSMSRTTNSSTNLETLTVTTAAAHGFNNTQTLKITGSSPSTYDISGIPVTASGSTLTFSVQVTPSATAQNIYQIQLSPTANPAISNVSLTNPAAGAISGTTNSAHNLHIGESIIVSSPSDGNGSKYPGTFTVTASDSAAKTFSASGGPSNLSGKSGVTATVTPDTTQQTITALTRTSTVSPTTAKGTVATSGWFGKNIGDTKTVNISLKTGSVANESEYATSTSNVVITCTTANCTQFTYPITVSPASTIDGTAATVGLSGSSAATIAANTGITRTGAAATATATLTQGSFTVGQTVNVSSVATLSSESAYVGTWTVSSACSTVGSTCTLTKTVTQSPAVSATGTIKAYSASTPPDRDTMIRWIRGYDNYGGESGPGGTVTVRPSIHGDVLHSRPLVINYGDSSRGIVVFYGSNDGVYRAVNGNQLTGNIGGVAPGGELWGLVLPEHYGLYSRQRLDTPEIKFPSTLIASAQPKDYFVDGQTASYQKIASDGVTIGTAYIYLTMRRGGRFMYALDVTQPTQPKVQWKKSSADTGFEELGQTWSRPRATVVQGGGLGVATPVLIFGAGYDPAQDSEPPATNTVGRGIYVVRASDGAIVWSANSTCTTSATCRNVPGMNFSIPSDISFVDRDGDGLTDRLYFGDTGGNLWRADISAADSTNWTVTKLAQLGCDDGNAPAPSCSDGKAPRKFFFPPAVLSIKAPGDAGAFDAVSIPSGDREHPLKSTATGASYAVADKFFMINDLGSSLATPTTSNVKPADLANSTSTPYSGTTATTYPKGFYINFATAEKGVNAPLATNGLIFFATNRPVDPSSTCAANLGEAKAYAVSPFQATTTSNLIVGGGLPPSPVAGLITVTTNNADHTTTTSEEKFCIGCAAECVKCSALENSPPVSSIPKNIKRTYWYKK